MANAPIATNKPKSWKAKPLAVGIASLLVPGLGQWLNRQRLKALIMVFSFLLFILAIELGSSQWGRYLELKQGKVPPEALATAAYQNASATQEETSSQSDYMSALFGDSGQEGQTAGSGDPFADSTNAQENNTPAGSGDPFAQAAVSEENNKPGSTSEAKGADAEQGNYFNATYRVSELSAWRTTLSDTRFRRLFYSGDLGPCHAGTACHRSALCRRLYRTIQ